MTMIFVNPSMPPLKHVYNEESSSLWLLDWEVATVPDLGADPQTSSSNKIDSSPPTNLHENRKRAYDRLVSAGYGLAILSSYERYSSDLFDILLHDDGAKLSDAMSVIAIKSGALAAEALPSAALKALRLLQNDPALFYLWLDLMMSSAPTVPESMLPILLNTEKLLTKLNIHQLRAWIFAGIRFGGTDPEARLIFFTFADLNAQLWLDKESGATPFFEIKRELGFYINALWGVDTQLIEHPINLTDDLANRTSFSRDTLYFPPTFPAYFAQDSASIYYASAAHIGAHLRFSLDKFPVRQLKPLQVAIISLIEDARAESMAMNIFPGLRQLWGPFHNAVADDVTTAPKLFARLAHALFDDNYKDDNSWVMRGRDMVLAQRKSWTQENSRHIGGILANELGQMRVQFNAKSFIVEPAYRDDNRGLWEFASNEQSPSMESSSLDSLHINQIEDNLYVGPMECDEAEDDELNQPPVKILQLGEPISVATYPEYDYLTDSERPNWTTIIEHVPNLGSITIIDDTLEKYKDVVSDIEKLIGNAKIGHARKINKKYEGHDLDIDACIESEISRRVGQSPDGRVYSILERRNRNLAVMVLLDISESTNDRLENSNVRVIDVESQAAALLAKALTGLGDPFAISAFCSNKREDVRYYRIKDFDSGYDNHSKMYLAGLSGGFSTRLGAALRHSALDLKTQHTQRRLILVLSDGQPSDIDVKDDKYLVEDTRYAIHGLAKEGINVFCVALNAPRENNLNRIFGVKNFFHIDDVRTLPSKLPSLYIRLTS